MFRHPGNLAGPVGEQLPGFGNTQFVEIGQHCFPGGLFKEPVDIVIITAIFLLNETAGNFIRIAALEKSQDIINNPRGAGGECGIPFQQKGFGKFTGHAEQELQEKAAGIQLEMLQLVIMGTLYLFQQLRQMQDGAGPADMHMLRQKDRGGRQFPYGAFIRLQGGKPAGERLVLYVIRGRTAFFQPVMIEMDVKIGTGCRPDPPVFPAWIQQKHIPGTQLVISLPFSQIHISGKNEIQDEFFQLPPDMYVRRLYMYLICKFYDRHTGAVHFIIKKLFHPLLFSL